MVTEEKIKYDAQQAITALAQLTSQLKEATQAVDGLNQGTDESQKKTFVFGKKIGEAGESLNKTGGALGRFKQAAGVADSGVKNLVDDLSDAVEGMGSLLSSSSSLVMGFGAVAIAVAAGAALWAKFKKDLEEANKEMETAALNATKMATSVDKLNASEKKMKLEFKVSKGLASEEDLAKFNAEQEAASMYSEQRADATDRLTRATIEYNQAEDETQQALAKSKMDLAIRDLDSYGEKERKAADYIYKTNVQLDKNADALANAKERKAEMAKVTDGFTNELWAEFKAAVAFEKQWAEVEAAVIEGQLAPGLKDIRVEASNTFATLSSRVTELGGVFPDVLTPADKLKLLLMDIAAAEDTIGTEGVKALTAALEKSADSYTTKLQNALDMASNLTTSSGVMSVVGSMGPWGKAIETAFTILKDANGEAFDSMHEDFMSVFENLGNLPDTLTEAIKNSITEGMPAFADAIPELITGLISNLDEAVIMGLTSMGTMVSELFQALLFELPSALVDALAMLWIEVKQEIKAWFEDAKSLGDDANSKGEKVQNTVVDILRGIAAVATAGASEVVYNAANRATGGQTQEVMYAGTRERKTNRSKINRDPANGLIKPNQMTDVRRENLDLQGSFNDMDNRRNLISDSGVRQTPWKKRRN